MAAYPLNGIVGAANERPDEDEALESAEMPQTVDEDEKWLSKARDAYTQSTDWFDASLRKTVEKAMAHFNNQHAPGSKYHTDTYKFRAKGFRPKTRATIRRNEANAAVAFFATADLVNVTAEDSEDKEQIVSAAILSELMNYRLDDSIPWFQTVIGAYQNTMNVGVVISHQHWEFEERSREYPVMDEDGNPAVDEMGQPMSQEVRQILTDKPRIDLVAIENFRISPAADWTDPIGTTPYIVEMIPMFVGDIKEKMEAGVWREYAAGEIAQAMEEQYDSIRAARDGKKRQDNYDISHVTSDFDTVFVHRNIMRHDGEDVLFYTLGTSLLLSDPVPLQKEYRHLRPGERPYVMGYSIIEAHKNYPSGLNELTATLQEEANDISNQRRDNVSLILNKRYFARRTANIDYKSLTRNVPGSITLVDDINADIRWDSPGEVTGSSYQEQDRVSIDYDELAGAFSPGSVQTNRQMNETVGGMNMLSADANLLMEYQLRVFSETWAEPVLKQLCRMEQAYETDQVVLSIAGKKAQLFQKFGISEVNDALLQGMVTVRVNVGFGATQPEKRIGRLTMGLQTMGQFAPMVMQSLDPKELATEVFGALGFKGAERFFPSLNGQVDPQVQQLQQQIQQLQSQLQGKQMELQAKAQMNTENNQTKLQLQQNEAAAEFELEKLRMAMSAIDKRLEKERNQIEVGRLQNERAALMSQMQQKQREMSENSVYRMADFKQRQREHGDKVQTDRQKIQPNPSGSMSTVLANDRYNMVPGAVG